MLRRILLYLLLVETCSGKLFQSNSSRGPWDDEINERVVDDTCDCGLYDRSANQHPPWTVFIQRKGKEESKLKMVCTGTIITSNLLLTSHECLESKGKQFNVYDIWMPRGAPRNMLDKSDLVITIHSGNSEILYSVVQIIYSHRFAVSSATNSTPEDDVVLIQVQPDFKSLSPQVSPICIANGNNPKFQDLRGQYPYYYGFVDNSFPGSWSYGATCSGETGMVLSPPGSVTGNLVNEDDCDQNPDKIDEVDEVLLCFRRTSGKSPKKGDGVLLLDSVSDEPRTFIVGITAANSDEKERPEEDKSAEYIRFSKISRLTKYIEFHAKRVNSRWCRTGDLVLVGEDESPADRKQERSYGFHPWDQPGISYPRDESLKCVCGLKNGKGGASSRIIGGETAVPHEFPWMTYIQIYVAGRALLSYATCTGEIINDRIVMTAGHCVLAYRLVSGKLVPNGITPPDDIDLFINAHHISGAGDKVIRRRVKYIHLHPDFLTSRQTQSIPPYSLDIVLLELDTPVNFESCGEGLRPICLPPPPTVNLHLGGQYGTIAGWGGTVMTLTSDGKTNKTVEVGLPNELQKATIKIQDRHTCEQAAVHFQGGSLPKELCTTNETSLNNAFKGDSGGPLMTQMYGSRQYMVVGTVSEGDARRTSATDSRLSHYVFFAPVQRHVKFIEYVSLLQTGEKSKWCQSSL